MATVIEPKQTTSSVAKVIEITAEASESFEDAIAHGIAKAANPSTRSAAPGSRTSR